MFCVCTRSTPVRSSHKVYELRFRAEYCDRRTSSRCSDDEVSSLLELPLAADATILYTLVWQSRAMHPLDALPTHQPCLSNGGFANAASKDWNTQECLRNYLPTLRQLIMALLGRVRASTHKALFQTLSEL